MGLRGNDVTVMSALYGAVGGTVGMALGNLFFFRWLLRYRTARRGRRVGLRDVMRPSDGHASPMRRLWLKLIGVTAMDIGDVHLLWRTGGAEKPATAMDRPRIEHSDKL
jgi:hypothetical protein